MLTHFPDVCGILWDIFNSKHPVRFRAVSFFSVFNRDGSVRFRFFFLDGSGSHPVPLMTFRVLFTKQSFVKKPSAKGPIVGKASGVEVVQC